MLGLGLTPCAWASTGRRRWRAGAQWSPTRSRRWRPAPVRRLRPSRPTGALQRVRAGEFKKPLGESVGLPTCFFSPRFITSSRVVVVLKKGLVLFGLCPKAPRQILGAPKSWRPMPWRKNRREKGQACGRAKTLEPIQTSGGDSVNVKILVGRTVAPIQSASKSLRE